MLGTIKRKLGLLLVGTSIIVIFQVFHTNHSQIVDLVTGLGQTNFQYSRSRLFDQSKLSGNKYQHTEENFSQYTTAKLNAQNITRRSDSVSKQNHCLKTPWQDFTSKVDIPEDQVERFTSEHCFIPGTEQVQKYGYDSSTGCLCKEGWSGDSCSIPEVVRSSLRKIPPRYSESITVRNRPRRLIHAFPFNKEFDHLEIRLAEMGDIVDVFVILESNYTAYGTPKTRELYNRLKRGEYKSLTCKLVYVFLDFFPEGASKNGWIADEIHRKYIGQEKGLVRINNIKPDDLILLTDSDEIPSRESLLFLKYHDGYPEPIGFTYKWTIYGFFWGYPRGIQEICSMMTYGMTRSVIRNNLYKIRSVHKIYADKNAVGSYLKSKTGGPVLLNSCWYLGSTKNPAGYHCSWCFDSEGIKSKLESAQNGDFPRWGDFPQKLRIPYIDNLVKTGTWFDDKTKFVLINPSSKHYAPQYVLKNKRRFKNLLRNPHMDGAREEDNTRFL